MIHSEPVENGWKYVTIVVSFDIKQIIVDGHFKGDIRSPFYTS